jgi:hypothetical protein
MLKARARAKPPGLFIHPNSSNLARADAVAVELGLHGSTEHVSGVGAARMSSDSDDHERTWDRGRGRDAARTLLGGPKQGHARSASQQRLFEIGGSGSESDG